MSFTLVNMVHEGTDQQRSSPAPARARRNRRRERRERKLDDILDAALDIVAAEGLEGLTMSRLARELDYVPAALYRYFDSKDAIVAAMQRRTVTELHADLKRERAGWAERLHSEPDCTRAIAELLAAARFYSDLPARMPERFRLVSVLMGDPRPLVGDDDARRVAPMILGVLAEVRDLFEAAERAGALDAGDALERTLAYWSSLQGVLQTAKLARMEYGAFEPGRLSVVTAETLLRGWGADPDTIETARRALARAAHD